MDFPNNPINPRTCKPAAAVSCKYRTMPSPVLCTLFLLFLGCGFAFRRNPQEISSDTALNMGGHPIFNLPLPTSSSEAASKEYVDAGQSGSFHAVSYLTTDLICPPIGLANSYFNCSIWGRSSTMLGEARAGQEEDVSFFRAELMAEGVSYGALPIVFEPVRSIFLVKVDTSPLLVNTSFASVYVWYHNKQIASSPASFTLEGQAAAQATVECDTSNLCAIPRGGGIPCTIVTKDAGGWYSVKEISSATATWTASDMIFPVVAPPTVLASGNEYVFTIPGWVMGENVLVEVTLSGATIFFASTTFTRMPTLPLSNTWVEYTETVLPTAPAACYHSHATCVGAWCWKTGGSSPSTAATNRFDLVCGMWTEITNAASTPANLAQSSNPMMTRDGKLHCMGRSAAGSCPSDVHVFDITTEQWESTYEFPLQDTGNALNGHASNLEHGVVAGGYSCSNGDPANVNVDVFWRFNPDSATWNDMGTAPRADRGVSLAMTSDNILHYGGGNAYATTYYHLNMTEQPWQWVQGPSYSVGHKYGAFVEVGEYACLLGGISAASTSTPLVECIRFGDASFTTSVIPNLPFNAYSNDAMSIPLPSGGHLVVVFQGYDYGVTDCEGRTWQIYLP